MNILLACEESATVRDMMIARGHNAWSSDLLPTRGRQANHLQGDVRYALDGALWHFPNAIDCRTGNRPLYIKWDMIIGFPPCTYLTCSAEWAYKDPDFVRYPGVGYHQRLKPGTLFGAERRAARVEAIEFAKLIWQADCERIAIENPVGVLSRDENLGEPAQTIQPYDYGEDASKRTCLWLKGLPPLEPSGYFKPRLVCKTCKARNVYDAAFGKGCVSCGAEPGLLLPRWSNQTDSGQSNVTPSDDRGMDRSVTYPGIAKAMCDFWLQKW